EVLEVQARLARGVRTEALEILGVRRRAVHEVHRRRVLARGEARRADFARVPRGVLVAVVAEPDDRGPPHARGLARDTLVELAQREAVAPAHGVLDAREERVDVAVVLDRLRLVPRHSSSVVLAGPAHDDGAASQARRAVEVVQAAGVT